MKKKIRKALGLSRREFDELIWIIETFGPLIAGPMVGLPKGDVIWAAKKLGL